MTETAVLASRRAPLPGDQLVWEPSERHVRGELSGVTVVDSSRAVLVWEPGLPVPHYVFPAEDVRTDLLTDAGRSRDRAGAAAWFDLTVGAVRRVALVWRYGGTGDLDGYLGFEWFRHEGGLDRWFEEDEEVFVHPRDPYKRIDALPSSRRVVVSLNGEVLADSHDPVALFETGLPIRWYLPAGDVRLDRLGLAAHTTRCPYKGIADAFTVHGTEGDLAWRYPDPLASVEILRDRIAFYNERVDITVTDARPTE